jgi:hypothetical protein
MQSFKKNTSFPVTAAAFLFIGSSFKMFFEIAKQIEIFDFI